MNPKPNITLWIALAIPAVMIILVTGAIYLPGLWAKPVVSFVFVLGGDGYYGPTYGVQNGRIAVLENRVPTPSPVDTYPKPVVANPKIYFYDIVQDTTRELTLDEASKFSLSGDAVSPDGYEVGYANGGGDFLFFSGPRDYDAKYIRGHGISRKLNIPRTTDSPYYYSGNFRFIGWAISRSDQSTK